MLIKLNKDSHLQSPCFFLCFFDHFKKFSKKCYFFIHNFNYTYESDVQQTIEKEHYLSVDVKNTN